MAKYNSSVNVIGSIPDYGVMIDYIIGKHEGLTDYGAAFKFRTEKSFTRFDTAISDSITRFANSRHSQLFFDVIKSEFLSLKEKGLIIFWQLYLNNQLFREITDNVLLPAISQGRKLLTSSEILSFLRDLKNQNPGELNWSEATLKIIGSKYLTILKKIDLAEGKQNKTLHRPIISQVLLIYLVKLISAIGDSERIDLDDIVPFAFTDKWNLALIVKKPEFTTLWNVTQIGDDIKIELPDGNI